MLLAPIIYAPAQCFAKLSLLFFYLRITPQLWFLRISKALICIVVSYTIAITLSNLFACQPIQAAWDGSIADKQCINTSALYITTAALNIATDITMLVLPIPVVIPLQMSRRQKAEVVVIFVLGSLWVCSSTSSVHPRAVPDRQLSACLVWPGTLLVTDNQSYRGRKK